MNDRDMKIDIIELQEALEELKAKGFNKKQLCDLCIPFRNKYKLTDSQTLQIARKDLSLKESCELCVGENN